MEAPITFSEVPVAALAESRVAYLSLLPRCQELFLELSMRTARGVRIAVRGRVAGYAIISAEDTLVEFHCDAATDADAVLAQLVRALGVRSVYCKSFDVPLLTICRAQAWPERTAALLYRDLVDPPPKSDPSTAALTAQFAEQSDLSFLEAQDDEVFEPKELLATQIMEESIVLFRSHDVIVGCGFLTRIHPRFPHYDVGVWVAPTQRRRGVATHIISYLRDLCLRNAWVPVCGCDATNEASQRTLKKAGFVSKHSLSEFVCQSQ